MGTRGEPMQRNTAWPLFLSVVVLGVFTEQEAMGYTDPGSGALLWQLLASAFVGVMFYGRKALNWTRRRKNREE